MIDCRFEVPLPPRGKDRPRLGRSGHVYTPSATVRWETSLALMAKEHMPPGILDEPLRVDVIAVLPRPKRLLRKQDHDGLIWAPARPDLDNVLKATLDALKSFWRDDALVVHATMLKVYAERAGRPRMVVRIRSVGSVSSATAAVVGSNR